MKLFWIKSLIVCFLLFLAILGVMLPTTPFFEPFQDKNTTYSNILTNSNANYLNQGKNAPQITPTNPSVYSPTSNPMYLTDSSANYNNDNYRYNPDNFTAKFHDTIADINKQTGDASLNTIMVIDQCGNQVYLPNKKIQGNATFYEPNTFPYGASNYVPSYEDSVFLSRTTGFATYFPIQNTDTMLGGFCKQNANFPDLLETKCNQIDKDTCGSVSCCVLLGGQKCVAGNENGPVMRSNYSDRDIMNRDYYYYQGKCFGNCG